MHVQVERNGSTVILGLPAKGQDMMDCLRLIGVTDPFDTVFTVTNIRSEVPELSRLEGREWDIDHLNLLARYMFGMDRNEIKQFSAAIYASDCNDLTDLINLSQNLNNYTLIDSRWDLNAIGRKHVLNTEGGMPEEEYNKRDFAGIAVDLLRSPNIVETPYGIVHINGLEEQRVFNGRNMPQYIDGGFSIMCRAEYTCRSEHLCLPCDEVDLEKALHRLGADDYSQVSIDIEEIRFITADEERAYKFLSELDIYGMNGIAKIVSGFKDSTVDQLRALLDYAGGGNYEYDDFIRLAESADDFILIPDVDNEKELGYALIHNANIYKYDENLESYYDYEALGKDILSEQNGAFVDNYYIGILSGRTIDEILGHEEQSM